VVIHLFFLQKTAREGPVVEILLKEKIFTKEQKPEIYNPAGEAELLGYFHSRAESILQFA
jgi:hypothetical protein